MKTISAGQTAVSGAANPDLGGSRIYVYVRTTGSDVTGNGTLVAPYRTLLYAAKQLSSTFHNGKYVVDITGITEVMDNATFSAFFTPDYYSFNLPGVDYPPWWYDGSVTVQAIPTVLATIAPGDITSQIAAASSGLITTTINGVAWGINAYRGKYLVDVDGFHACIASNTANVLETTGIQPMTGPLTIVDLTAELHNNNGGAWQPTLNVRHSRAPIAFSGIKFTTDAAAPSLGLDDVGSILFTMCNINGVTCRANSSILFSDCYFTGVCDFRAQQGTVSGFLNGCTFPNLDSECDRGSINYGPLIARGCAALGHVDYAEHVENHVFYIHNALIDTSTAAGVNYNGGSRCFVNHCVIKNSTTAGIYAFGPGILHVADTIGTANGTYGLFATDGSQVKVAASDTVTGAAGDVKIGGLVAATWAAVVGAPSTLDGLLATSTGARVFV